MKENKKTPNKTIGEWLKFADENFAVAGHELERDDAACHTICFLCQEAAEKYLKAYLISKGWELKKTHDIVELLEYCSDYDDDFDQLVEAGRVLNDYVVEGRYPGNISFETIEIVQAQEAYKLAENIKECVVARLGRID
ncbi:MAG: HEPN domain-containing protein [Candidatus Scalindua sp.]|nr:HEPN domain-containing protein [Candidatus Scalindua sp.]